VSEDRMKPIQAAMYVYAARYCHDRDTSAAMQVVHEILNVWESFPSKTQETLKREAMIATKNKLDWRKISKKCVVDYGDVE